MLTDKKDIEEWLKKYCIGKYRINDDFTVEVNTHVNLTNKKLTDIAVQFSRVKGSFDCSFNQLTSLEGCPHEVGGNFNIRNNSLTSLKCCPEIVGGYFDCRCNSLRALENTPKTVGQVFYCGDNAIQSLEKFNCHFHGNLIHFGEVIPLLENFYTQKNDLFILEISYNQLQNIFLNYKLNDNIRKKKDIYNQKKNKI